MADFCRDHGSLCDLAFDLREDEMIGLLCEGCGTEHWVDAEGYRLAWDDKAQRWVRA